MWAAFSELLMLLELKPSVFAAIPLNLRIGIYKNGFGATETVNWLYFEHTNDAIQALKAHGYSIYAVEQVVDSISLENFNSDNKKVAVVFGNEVEGVDADVLPNCDGSIEIPQLGMKHSLNISVAAGIVLWDLTKPRLKDLVP